MIFDIKMDGARRSDDAMTSVGERDISSLADPVGLRPVDARALAPFQRALLRIDGTLTTFLEAYLGEPLEVEPLTRTRVVLAEDHPWLDVPKGREAALRRVLIRGRHSRVVLVHAAALIVLDRLPKGVARRLEAAGASLGRILREERIETHREILRAGEEPGAVLPEGLRDAMGDPVLTRVSRIFAGGRPVALINEKFPRRPRSVD